MNRFWPIILGVAALLLDGCGRPRHVAPASHLSPLPVRTARVELISKLRLQPVAGTVLPVDRAIVSARIMGGIASASFRVGQPVTKGEVVVRISAAEMTARLQQAEAASAQLERDFHREALLEARGASTSETVRSLADRRKIAEAAVAEARTMLDYTEVKAPFSGAITRKFVNTGDFASPGTPLFALEDESRLRAEVQVPESLPLPALDAAIDVQSGDERVCGRLAEYSTSADPLSRTRLAKIDLPADTAFRSGQFVRVLWPASHESVISVPANSVSLFGQMERVFTVRDGKAHLVLVRTGERDGERLQILAGLNAGEHIVISPPAELRDGRLVEVQP